MQVPGLIGSAANNPTRLIGDVRFRHSCLGRGRFIVLAMLLCCSTPELANGFLLATPRSDRRKPARNRLRFFNLLLKSLNQRVEIT